MQSRPEKTESLITKYKYNKNVKTMLEHGAKHIHCQRHILLCNRFFLKNISSGVGTRAQWVGCCLSHGQHRNKGDSITCTKNPLSSPETISVCRARIKP